MRWHALSVVVVAAVSTILSVGSCLAATPAAADTVVLRNGDRLSGLIVHLSPETLTLETRYAGEVRISRSEIASFATAEPVPYLVQAGARPVRAVFAAADEPGVVTIDNGEGPREIPLARVAVLKPKPEETQNGVARTGRVSLSTSWSQGNSDSKRIWGEADYAARAHQWRYELGLKVRRQSDDDQTTADQLLVNGNYDRFVSADRFAYLRSSFERDRFKDLTLRSAVGGGYGLQLIDDDRTQLSVRGGIEVIHENRISADDERFPAAGWGVALKRQVSFADAEVFHDQQGFWNLDDSDQMNLRSRTGIRFPVRGGIIASLQLDLDWERTPVDGRRSTDSTWLLGLGYAW